MELSGGLAAAVDATRDLPNRTAAARIGISASADREVESLQTYVHPDPSAELE
ncbi:hypothetical protein [Kitasatospora sp. NPDC098663]|uniref:hypothetical protein n=1 Tax=Kitasatospora sp. NPDC098663 TaxID=3364096 RepID=UPI00381639B0